VYMVHTTVVPGYYEHNRHFRSTDTWWSQDGDTYQPNDYH